MRSINARQLHELMGKHPHMPVVDVLPHEVHARAHIPGSINIPLSDARFIRRVRTAVEDSGLPVVVYCKDEHSDASPQAAAQLEGAGFKEVFGLRGGTEAWAAAGYTLVPS